MLLEYAQRALDHLNSEQANRKGPCQHNCCQVVDASFPPAEFKKKLERCHFYCERRQFNPSSLRSFVARLEPLAKRWL